MQLHEELYRVLSKGSEEDVSRTLYLIRAGADVESVVRRLKDCELLLQFSAGPDQIQYVSPHMDRTRRS